MYLGVATEPLSVTEEALSSTTKLGGRPTFSPEVRAAPNSAALFAQFSSAIMCGRCKQSMFMIAQAFSPLVIEGADADGGDGYTGADANRMVYVFGCNSEECTRLAPVTSFAAVAVQIDCPDSTACDDADDDDDDDDAEGDAKSPATPPSSPAAPAGAADASSSPAAVATTTTPTASVVPCPAFAALGIDVEEASVVAGSERTTNRDGDDDVDDRHEPEPEDLEAEMRKVDEINARAAASGNALDHVDMAELDNAIDLKDKRIDQMYSFFTKQMERCPRQVMRYCPGGTPLFQNPQVVFGQPDFPSSCDKCGKPLHMELQIMPTAVYLLRCFDRVDTAAHPPPDDGMDFGTLTIYSCSAKCDARARGCQLTRLHVLAEPAPSLREDDQAATREGKVTMRDLALGADEVDATRKLPPTN